MYVGFNLLTISSIIYTNSIFISIIGIYSIIIYHFIIIGEEKFLERTFKSKFVKYKENVKRYI